MWVPCTATYCTFSVLNAPSWRRIFVFYRISKTIHTVLNYNDFFLYSWRFVVLYCLQRVLFSRFNTSIITFLNAQLSDDVFDIIKYDTREFSIYIYRMRVCTFVVDRYSSNERYTYVSRWKFDKTPENWSVYLGFYLFFSNAISHLKGLYKHAPKVFFFVFARLFHVWNYSFIVAEKI